MSLLASLRACCKEAFVVSERPNTFLLQSKVSTERVVFAQCRWSSGRLPQPQSDSPVYHHATALLAASSVFQSAIADQYDRPTSLAAAYLIRLCLMVIMQSLTISYILAYQHNQTMPCCFMLHTCCRSLLPATAPRMSCARSSVTQLSKL